MTEAEDPDTSREEEIHEVRRAIKSPRSLICCTSSHYVYLLILQHRVIGGCDCLPLSLFDPSLPPQLTLYFFPLRYKATLKNPNVSEEKKEHARQVLKVRSPSLPFSPFHRFKLNTGTFSWVGHDRRGLWCCRGPSHPFQGRRRSRASRFAYSFTSR
jgi:hypothetical protein